MSTDLILIFEEDTPLEIIKLLKPDILIKGDDVIEKVVGYKEAQEWGGRAFLAEHAGYSTTEIIQRIKNRITIIR